MSDSKSYLTIAEGVTVTAEVVEKRSRFIAQLAHVSSEAEATAFVADVRTRHRDARHNVPAWILADGRERTSDDGEPQRTAGMPTLDVLRGAGLADVCCVTTRYFGGTLLGAGGLVRAYAAAASAAVEVARAEGRIVTMTSVTPVTVVIPYAAYDRVVNLVATSGGRVRDSVFAADVQLNCAFVTGAEAGFVAAMTELFDGDVEVCRVGVPTFAAFR